MWSDRIQKIMGKNQICPYSPLQGFEILFLGKISPSFRYEHDITVVIAKVCRFTPGDTWRMSLGGRSSNSENMVMSLKVIEWSKWKVVIICTR